MGCGSQAGCLGPKPREREVYLDLMDTIHQQALKMQVPQKDDPYIYVKGQLSKKGLLRKLIDNLVSHKTNLYECANQILDITLSATSLCELVASLVVVDKIIDQFFRQQDQSQIKQKELKRSLTNEILPAILAMTLPTYSEVPVDIIQRMNVVYFKIVIVLLEKEKSLKKYVLCSLSSFLSLKSDKILCKVQTFRIFELLIDTIKSRAYVQECTQIFAQILSRIKENTCKEVNKDYILFFIRNWFFRQDKESRQVIESYQKVLKELINTYCGNTELLVREFTVVLDEVHFERREADKIEELLLTSLDNAESTRNLIRTLAVYIIKYLQIGTEDNLQITCSNFKNCDSEKSKLNGFKLISKWIAQHYINIDTIIEYNPSSMINFFVTSNEKGTSEPFKQELKQEYFKVIESVKPQSIVILTNLLAELMKDKGITKQRREIFYSLFQDILRIRSSLLSDQTYNTQIRLVLTLERHYHKELKFQLLSFASRGIKNWNILKIKTNPEANELFRSRICQFLHSLFDIIVSNFENTDRTSQQTHASIDQNSKKLSRLANLHRFTLQAAKVIKVFNDHHLQCYLLVLVDNICQYLKDIDPEDEKDAIILYFLAYLIQYSLFLMNKKQRMTQPLSKLSLTLEKEPFVHDLRTQIITTARAMLLPPDSLSVLGQSDTVSSPHIPHSNTQLLIQRYETKVNAIRQLFLIKENQWNEIVETFKQYFGEAIRESRSKYQKQIFAERDFNRMSSLNVSLNEIENEKGSTRNEGQESFRQIIDKLHQQ